jgi:hypothetical protein
MLGRKTSVIVYNYHKYCDFLYNISLDNLSKRCYNNKAVGERRKCEEWKALGKAGKKF